jgi:hypothetical protein
MKTFWNRRGALFGFDARISLGVFALLGVVIGIATYAAANHAREVSRENAVKTAMLAFDGYVRDTKQVPVSFNNFFTNPSVTGWNGPYIKGNFSQVSDGVWRFDDYSFSIGQGAVGQTGSTPSACSDASDCYTTITVTSTKDVSLLDTQLDGSSTPTTGTVRVDTSGGVNTAYIFMKGSVKASMTPVVEEPGGDMCSIEICKGGKVWDADACACVDEGGGLVEDPGGEIGIPIH